MQFINTDKAPAVVGPYSKGIVSQNFVFTSGQIGLKLDKPELVSDSVEEQVKQVFKNLDAVLSAAGSDKDLVVKAEVFVIDLKDFEVVNGLFAEYFGDHKPARTTIQVAALPKNAKVEISFTAEIKG